MREQHTWGCAALTHICRVFCVSFVWVCVLCVVFVGQVVVRVFWWVNSKTHLQNNNCATTAGTETLDTDTQSKTRKSQFGDDKFDMGAHKKKMFLAERNNGRFWKKWEGEGFSFSTPLFFVPLLHTLFFFFKSHLRIFPLFSLNSQYACWCGVCFNNTTTMAQPRRKTLKKSARRGKKKKKKKSMWLSIGVQCETHTRVLKDKGSQKHL